MTDRAKHTPGPWVVVRTAQGYVSHITAPEQDQSRPGGLVDLLRPKASFCSPSSLESRANAELMAAAPDLLEACERLLEHVHTGFAKNFALAAAAILKAKGES